MKDSLNQAIKALVEKIDTEQNADQAMKFTQAALNAAHALSIVSDIELLKQPNISKMVDKFLGWELPHDFNPDGGIDFVPSEHQNHPRPVGTNLLDADQAKETIRYITEQ